MSNKSRLTSLKSVMIVLQQFSTTNYIVKVKEFLSPLLYLSLSRVSSSLSLRSSIIPSETFSFLSVMLMKFDSQQNFIIFKFNPKPSQKTHYHVFQNRMRRERLIQLRACSALSVYETLRASLSIELACVVHIEV